jgi:hypothetical protein
MCCVAAILVLLASSGCATMLDRDTWNINRFRDERAVDIDQRLETSQPIVQNPF